MCGIAGWIKYNGDLTTNENRQVLHEMQDALAKRGPDAKGEYIARQVGLVHRRLVVVDPETGGQPMTKTVNGETFTIVYNGELYNTDQLRNELVELGYTFETKSDTEVLLTAFIQWREKSVAMLNGIFAFAIWDNNNRKLFIARDKFGVKPLFFVRTKHGIVFASEVKSIFKNPLCPALLDKDGINKLFLLSPARIIGDGVYKNVRELGCGEYMWCTCRGIRIHTYWKLRARPHKLSVEESAMKLRELVTDAIERQTVSDVPLGTFLSGGLDSSIITTIVAQKYAAQGQTLATFSVDFKDNDKNFVKNEMQPDTDEKYINIMREFAKTDHKFVVLDNDTVIDALRPAAIARDFPGMADIDASLVPFCTAIKETHTVCLSGECADELFAGYPWYFATSTMFNAFPWARSLDMRTNLVNKKYLCKNPQKFIQKIINKTVRETDTLPSDTAQDKYHRALFKLNLDWFMQTLLERKDRMSMACGLEVRVPFCDERLVEFAYNLPFHIKTLNGREKGLLRYAFREVLPPEIVDRKKNPYPKTFDPNFMACVKQMAIDVMDKSGIVSQIIDREYFNTLLQCSDQTQWFGQLMRLPQVFAWIVQMDLVFTNLGVKLVD